MEKITKFNPQNKSILTYGEILEPAMKITDVEDAKQYKAAYIKFQEKFLKNGVSESGMSAEQMVNTNLGYYAGYYDSETRERVERLFNGLHPIFGSVKTNGAPTAEEALKCGKENKSLNQIRK